MAERATSIEYLEFFAQNVNLGPGGSDEVKRVQNLFAEVKGKRPPAGWDHCPHCGLLQPDECSCVRRED